MSDVAHESTLFRNPVKHSCSRSSVNNILPCNLGIINDSIDTFAINYKHEQDMFDVVAYVL